MEGDPSARHPEERAGARANTPPPPAASDLERRLRDEIIGVLREAVTDSRARFDNPHLIRCWQRLSCDNEACRRALDDNPRCWQVAGTYCGGMAQGDFVHKHHDCSRCEVFRQATPTLIDEVGEHINNLLFLLHQEHRRRRRDRGRIAKLEEEADALRRALEDKDRALREAKTTDDLTGLFNDRHLEALLHMEFSRCRRAGKELALLIIDVDRFDAFNLEFGHLEGDRVLRSLAGLLNAATRGADAAFRIQGGTFALLLPDSDETSAWRVGERVRRRLSEARFEIARTGATPKRIGNATVSVGICSARRCETDAELRELAGQALYRAKADGGDTVVRWA